MVGFGGRGQTELMQIINIIVCLCFRIKHYREWQRGGSGTGIPKEHLPICESFILMEKMAPSGKGKKGKDQTKSHCFEKLIFLDLFSTFIFHSFLFCDHFRREQPKFPQNKN